MKKLLLITTTFILFSLNLLAQSAIKGVVLSNDSLPLVGAMVAVNGGTYYATCQTGGEFLVNKVPRRKVSVDISFLGYISYKTEIEMNGTTIDMGTIVLEEEENNIENVEVVTQSPLAVQKGDTTQYNAAAYKTNPDADAGSLIEKLPGVVSKDGKIEAQGETIKRIYIDGKLFFGDDVSSAITNLPADAIESIQIFDDMSDEARYTGVDDGQRDKAINLVTKNKRKTNVLGRIEASAGRDTRSGGDNRYVLGGNISYLGKNDRITVTGLVNNINLNRFGISSEEGSVEDLEDEANEKPGGTTDVKTLGVNYNRDTKKLKMSLSYYMGHRNSIYERTYEASYFPSSRYDSRESYSSSYVDNLNVNHQFSGRIISFLGKRTTLIINPRLTYRTGDYDALSDQLVIQDLDSTNRSANNNIQSSNYFQLAGNAILTRRFAKKGRRLSTSFYYNINRNNLDREQKYLYRDNYDTQTGLWNPSSNLNSKLIDQYSSGNVLTATLTYVEPISTTQQLSLSVTAGSDWGDTDKSSLVYDYDKEDFVEDTGQMNIFNRNYNNIGSSLGYSLGFDDFRLNAGVGYKKIMQHKEETKPTQYTGSYDFDEVGPYFNVKYSRNKTKYFRFMYRGRTLLPNINQMQNSINDASQSSLRVGNPDLKQGYQHSLTLFYTSSNIPKSTSFNINLYAESRSNYIANSTEVMPEDTILGQYSNYVPVAGAFLNRPINLDGYKSARMSTTYSFHIEPIKSNMNISLNYRLTHIPSLYQVLNFATSSTVDFRAALSSNISENVDFNFYTQTSYAKTINTQRNNTLYFKQNVYGSVNVIFFHRLVFNTVAALKYYQGETIQKYSSTYYPVNFALAYKFLRSRRAEFRVTLYDAFEQNKDVQQNQNTTSIQDIQTSVMGRYILGRFSYKFNTMNSSKKNTRRVAKKMNLTEAKNNPNS